MIQTFLEPRRVFLSHAGFLSAAEIPINYSPFYPAVNGEEELFAGFFAGFREISLSMTGQPPFWGVFGSPGFSMAFSGDIVGEGLAPPAGLLLTFWLLSVLRLGFVFVIVGL